MDSGKPKRFGFVRPSQNQLAAMEQNKAAGGEESRKIRTKSGDVVTVSLALAGDRVTLRFKMGGSTIQRTVGTVTATARAEALKQGWTMLREKRIVENEGWSWVVPTSSD